MYTLYIIQITDFIRSCQIILDLGIQSLDLRNKSGKTWLYTSVPAVGKVGMWKA